MKGGVSRPLPGVVLATKRVGETSFSLVEALQRSLAAEPGKKHPLCHAGALDPFAEGLLPVLVGSATRLFERVHELPKTYEATVRWGVETDTCDPMGREVTRGDPNGLSPTALEEALAAFVGWRAQVPPMTSNKRVDGERAWQRAQRGETFELPASDVFLFEAKFTEHDLPTRSVLRVVTRGGFYVRSLARDLGRAVGCGAHLETLRRTAIGPWTSAMAPTQLTGQAAVSWFPWVDLGDDEWGRLQAEQSTPTRRPPRAPTFVWPRGFPDPTPLVVAVHQRRVVALLEGSQASFRRHTSLLPPF